MSKELRFKCWIEIDNEKFFGPGPAQLLALIDEMGSLSKAAREMNMSYKKAWSIIDELNQKGSTTYVILHKGGSKGGGAELTETARNVLKSYKELFSEMYQITELHRRKILEIL
ncbi:winged helix-turn-helix domain-containing protein [Robertkochia solimangrovi]|uniref:winged helix-turn-helix domain-containing protein n=1 Tax=Robertkochia solimangrovi TaxID=2213046 RepID=UPI00118050CF|nr:LysR family transcriptional regulator [Robertkochia solimangrovi]TRZ41962.1 ModE family transcriptional regulator [Robertkochia solimangrovi]